MDPRKILMIATIVSGFVYCSADNNTKDLMVNDNIPATTVNKENEEIKERAAALTDPHSFEGKTLPEVIEALKSTKKLNDDNIKDFQEAFKDTTGKLDAHAVEKVENFFKDATKVENSLKSFVTNTLDTINTEFEKELGKKKNNSGKVIYGMISIISPLIVLVSVSF